MLPRKSRFFMIALAGVSILPMLAQADSFLSSDFHFMGTPILLHDSKKPEKRSLILDQGIQKLDILVSHRGLVGDGWIFIRTPTRGIKVSISQESYIPTPSEPYDMLSENFMSYTPENHQEFSIRNIVSHGVQVLSGTKMITAPCDIDPTVVTVGKQVVSMCGFFPKPGQLPRVTSADEGGKCTGTHTTVGIPRKTYDDLVLKFMDPHDPEKVVGYITGHNETITYEPKDTKMNSPDCQ